MNTTKATNTNIGVADLFLAMFVGLKITDQIDWSWWWVLSPLWISALAAILLIIIASQAE